MRMGGSEPIQRVLCLFYESETQDRSKLFFTRDEAYNGAIFKDLNRTFCCVHMVSLWFYQMYPYFFLFKIFLDCLGIHIVDNLEDWF